MKSQPTKKSKRTASKIGNGTMSMFMLLVVISIAYSSYVVAFGTENLTPKVMIVPQTLFAAMILVKQFVK